jgi:hypothetical protein
MAVNPITQNPAILAVEASVRERCRRRITIELAPPDDEWVREYGVGFVFHELDQHRIIISTEAPDAELVLLHELVHIDLCLSGFPTLGVPSCSERTSLGKFLMVINDTLIHVPHGRSMRRAGFPPERFEVESRDGMIEQIPAEADDPADAAIARRLDLVAALAVVGGAGRYPADRRRFLDQLREKRPRALGALQTIRSLKGGLTQPQPYRRYLQEVLKLVDRTVPFEGVPTAHLAAVRPAQLPLSHKRRWARDTLSVTSGHLLSHKIQILRHLGQMGSLDVIDDTEPSFVERSSRMLDLLKTKTVESLLTELELDVDWT